MIVSFFALVGCGGGGSGSQSPPPPPPEITSVVVTPNSAPVLTGASQLFTAQVAGTGSFNASVTWSVNGVNGGNSTFGTIVGGKYTAPAVLPAPSGVTITATSVQEPAVFGSSIAVLYAPPTLSSITPSAAIAGQQIALDGQYLEVATTAIFSGANGTSVSQAVQQISDTGVTTTVPFGATIGPVYVNVTPFVNVSIYEKTNSIALTRLPNLRIRTSLFGSS